VTSEADEVRAAAAFKDEARAYWSEVAAEAKIEREQVSVFEEEERALRRSEAQGRSLAFTGSLFLSLDFEVFLYAAEVEERAVAAERICAALQPVPGLGAFKTLEIAGGALWR
jgi:hypothetical protein